MRGRLENDLLAQAEAVGVSDPEAITETGDPVRLVCFAAEQHGVDVIVVGSHDTSVFRRLVDPSVATGLVTISVSKKAWDYIMNYSELS